MSQFEFFMSFYGLLLGLGVAELLLGFGNLLRERAQPRWGILTPLLGFLIFITVIATFNDAYNKLQQVDMTFIGVTAPALIGISLFAAALMAVPRDAADWISLDEYFMARRRWTIGALLVASLLTIVSLELKNVLQQGQAVQIAYWLINGLLIALLLVALLARRRRTVATALAAESAITIALYTTSLRIADWVQLLLAA